jgi:hypothetical protein
MYKQFAYLAVMLVVVFSGCGKSTKEENHLPSDEKKDDQQRKALDLSGKTVEEILALKYNKAELSCKLWVQRFETQYPPNTSLHIDDNTSKPDLTKEPDDFFVYDLKANPNEPKSFTLAGEVPNHYTVELAITFSPVHIHDIVHQDSKNLTIYSSSYSPYLNYGLFFKYNAISNDFKPIDSKLDQGKVYEKMPRKIMDHNRGFTYATEKATDHIRYHDHVECVINTEIKPEYSGQSRQPESSSGGVGL